MNRTSDEPFELTVSLRVYHVRRWGVSSLVGVIQLISLDVAVLPHELDTTHYYHAMTE